MRTIIGIDPGFDGAIAAIGYDGLFGEEVLTVWTVPVIRWKEKPRYGKKNARTVTEYDEGAIRDILAAYDPASTMVVIEKQQPMLRFDPNRWDDKNKKMGMNVPPAVQSTFNLAAGYFLYRGILAGLGLPYRIVAPKAWQKVMLAGHPKADSKVASVIVARHLFPGFDFRKSARCKVFHDGKCDAALIASFGRSLVGVEDGACA